MEAAEAKRLFDLEWESLSEEQKFYREREDIYKEPSIKFENTVIV